MEGKDCVSFVYLTIFLMVNLKNDAYNNFHFEQNLVDYDSLFILFIWAVRAMFLSFSAATGPVCSTNLNR